MVSQELLIELKDILKTDFGLSLTLDDVSKIAADLVGYFDLLAKINYENGKINIPLQTIKSSIDYRSGAQK